MIHDVTRSILLREQIVIPSFYLWRVAASFLPQVVGADLAAQSGAWCEPIDKYRDVSAAGSGAGGPDTANACG